MTDFISILKNTVVASTETGVTVTNQFKNINGDELLDKLRQVPYGNKDGSHFIRTSLNEVAIGRCMPRNDANTDNMANLLVIDCDKHIDENGCEIDGAPDPLLVHQTLRRMNIGHIIYGSYSHYTGNKGNRYRIILAAEQAYSKLQLPATAEAVVLLVNENIEGHLLAYAKENNVFAQAWYYSRKPVGSQPTLLYFEYLEGTPVAVIEPRDLPLSTSLIPSNYLTN